MPMLKLQSEIIDILILCPKLLKFLQGGIAYSLTHYSWPCLKNHQVAYILKIQLCLFRCCPRCKVEYFSK